MGSGTLGAPALIVLLKLDPFVGAAGHMLLGGVDYRLAGLLLAGAIPGVLAGSALVTRAPAALRPVVAALLAVSAARLFV